MRRQTSTPARASESYAEGATEAAFQPTGEMLAEVSTAIVRLYREHFGKGPTKAKTYALDGMVICVLRDGLTIVEKTLFNTGRADTARQVRSAFQDAVADRFTNVVERVTGRRVIAFMSQAHVDPDLAIEVFFLDNSLPANGSIDTDGNGRPPTG